MVFYLVKRLVAESGKLDFTNRSQAVGSHSDGHPHDGRFRQGGIDHTLLAESVDQPVGHPEDAAIQAHILTQYDHPIVSVHLLFQGQVERLNHCHLSHDRPPRLRPAIPW